MLDGAAPYTPAPSDSGAWGSSSSVSGILVQSSAPIESTTPVAFAAPVFAVQPPANPAQPSSESPVAGLPQVERMAPAAAAHVPPQEPAATTPPSTPELPPMYTGNAVTWTEFSIQAPPPEADFTSAPASAQASAPTPVPEAPAIPDPVIPIIACECGKKLRPRIEHLGKKIKCPACRKLHAVPAAVTAPTSSPQAPVPTLAEAITDLEKAEQPTLPKDKRKQTLKWLRFRSLSSPLRRKKKDITSSDEAEARRKAIDELGKSNDPRAAALLRPFLQDEWVNVREAAAAALGKLGDLGSL
ncbi:MAG TPA: HEAT repeat domain-containing protein, partial [Planctomycetaceae bacterium]|nr:HEAT repeat domain-containing protein [Planctomycetaceae bacterium]